jgi:excisionase family DNA binding protein
MAVDLSEYVSRSEAARVLACSGEYVAVLAKSGRLPSVRSPGGLIYRRADVERLAAERRGRAVRAG